MPARAGPGVPPRGGSGVPARSGAGVPARAGPGAPTAWARPPAFGTLSEADQFALRRWIGLARAAGFDEVKDLTARPWPAEISGAVLGVYTPGEDHASWLAVEQDGAWAVACCLDGSVSPPVNSLRDALEIVYRAGGASDEV